MHYCNASACFLAWLNVAALAAPRHASLSASQGSAPSSFRPMTTCLAEHAGITFVTVLITPCGLLAEPRCGYAILLPHPS